MEQRELTFVIPTYRLRDVGETVQEYDQHFWRNGHSVRMMVFDDSSPANQEKYFPLLERTDKARRDAHIAIGPDGTVLTATGELPPDLVDVFLQDCDGLSRELREAGKALLLQLRRSVDRVAIQTVALEQGRTVQLVAIEALAICSHDIRDALR